MNTFTIYIHYPRNEPVRLIGDYPAQDGKEATKLAINDMTQQGKFVPDEAIWIARENEAAQ